MQRLALFHAVLAAGLLAGGIAGGASADEATWKAGAARVKITPESSIWMAGYAARTKPSEGVAQDLFAKALAIEDRQGTRLVILTMDLISIPRDLRKWMEREVEQKHGLAPKSLLINVSHTHCGPEVRAGRAAEWDLPAEQGARIQAYSDGLRLKLLAAVGEALGKLAPAKLDYLHARCGLAMNRRRPTQRGFMNAPYSDGPVDHDVPVLRVTDPQSKQVLALAFGYACHNTTLGYYQFCGDYAGYAQQYLEEAHPETIALFVQGCGGDQNPYPRRTEELAQYHGRSLAVAVEAALETIPRTLSGPLALAFDEVPLDFAPPPAREELEKTAAAGKQPAARHARRLLDELAKNGKIRESYPCPVQVVRFGGDLTLVAIGGEVVVDYSLRLKRELAGPAVWVAGYSNDVFTYVPSLRVLKEGGYEGGQATVWGSLPGPFAESIEERIVGKVLELAGRK